MRIGFWEIMLLLAIVWLLFGHRRRLDAIRANVRQAIDGFSRTASAQRRDDGPRSSTDADARQGRTIEGEVISKEFDPEPLRRRPKV